MSEPYDWLPLTYLNYFTIFNDCLAFAVGDMDVNVDSTTNGDQVNSTSPCGSIQWFPKADSSRHDIPVVYEKEDEPDNTGTQLVRMDILQSAMLRISLRMRNVLIQRTGVENSVDGIISLLGSLRNT